MFRRNMGHRGLLRLAVISGVMILATGAQAQVTPLNVANGSGTAGTGPVKATATVPVVVEVFTSTNCPSCPATEAKLDSIAADRSDLLMVLEHVDYWNKGAAAPDPYSSPDFTQRQYDYSNRLSDRPGSVFTPQPVLEGQWVANPPLWLNWSSTLSKALKTPKTALSLERTNGGVDVSWPTGIGGNLELVVVGIERDSTHTNLWRATGINILEASNKDRMMVGSGDLPKGQKTLIMLQEAGAGAVKATGVI